jgi:two-component system chemotaxis response regulator CheB
MIPQADNNFDHIIVIGASAGGVEALKELARDLSPDIPAPILVVLHTSPRSPSLMPDILNRAGPIPACHAEDGQLIGKGNIYVAPPDFHLVIRKGYMQLTKGPKENGFRRAIDVLFRSAAKVYRSRVIGVILTGSLDNGAAGLLSVTTRGGLAVVQDPDDALYSGMPLNAIQAVDPEFILPLKDIPATLLKLARRNVVEQPVATNAPHDPDPHNNPAHAEAHPHEADDNENAAYGDDVYHEPNRKVSQLSCPDCGGVLAEYEEDNLLHFKCRVGHAYSAESLIAVQSEALENALWAALRALEENVELALRMAERARRGSLSSLLERYEDRAKTSQQHADVLRDLLLHWE